LAISTRRCYKNLCICEVAEERQPCVRLDPRMDDIPTIADFRSPPVVEVVCGIQFAPLVELRSAHIGLFWQRVREAYPIVRDAFALPPIVENFGAPSLQTITNLPFFTMGGGAPAPRVQLVDQQSGEMIQVQNGRFHHNWEKHRGEVPYRRYKNIRPAFVDRWEQFKRFVRDEALGDVRPTQYELSYVNHVLAGELWDPLRGVSDLLPWFSPPHVTSGYAFESQFAMHAPAPQCQGRLHVTSKVGLRQDGQSVLQLELTVRGAPAIASEDGDLVPWMDTARERIVRTFVELTSEKARRSWGQIQ
jgi:uncharacterized protein (TIGR04255 family)